MAFSCLSAATSPSMAPRIAAPSSCNRFFLSDFHPRASNFGSGQENHQVSSPFFPKEKKKKRKKRKEKEKKRPVPLLPLTLPLTLLPLPYPHP